MATQQTFAFDAISDTEDDFDRLSSPSTEPMALATGIEQTNVTPARPAASAVGSPNRIVSTSQTDPLPQAGEVTRKKTTRSPDRESILQKLRRQAGCVSTAPVDDAAVMSTGSPQIDSCLPRGGLRVDAINEWVSASNSSGTAVLSMITAATYFSACENHFDVSGPLVVVDRQGTFYPPAAVALGIPVSKIVLVRPQNHADHVWAIDQALRCESVAAVWSPIGSKLNDRDARRFQLAAESGKTPGFLIRPAAVRGRPTFADVRLYCEPAARAAGAGVQPLGCARQAKAWTPTTQLLSPSHLTLQVTIDRCRGGATGQSIQVEINDRGQLEHHETFTMHLASRLAHPKTTQSQAGARHDPRRRRA